MNNMLIPKKKRHILFSFRPSVEKFQSSKTFISLVLHCLQTLVLKFHDTWCWKNMLIPRKKRHILFSFWPFVENTKKDTKTFIFAVFHFVQSVVLVLKEPFHVGFGTWWGNLQHWHWSKLLVCAQFALWSSWITSRKFHWNWAVHKES